MGVPFVPPSGEVHTHHDDPDADAHPSDDVQLAVEHLVDGSGAALATQRQPEDHVSRPAPSFLHLTGYAHVCHAVVRYYGPIPFLPLTPPPCFEGGRGRGRGKGLKG